MPGVSMWAGAVGPAVAAQQTPVPITHHSLLDRSCSRQREPEGGCNEVAGEAPLSCLPLLGCGLDQVGCTDQVDTSDGVPRVWIEVHITRPTQEDTSLEQRPSPHATLKSEQCVCRLQ